MPNASGAGGPPTRRTAASGAADAVVDNQRAQQEKLKAVYDALTDVGSLRGYGSVSAVALLPAGIDSKNVTPDDQLLLTGVPTTAFAPSGGGGLTDPIVGVGGAIAVATASSQLGIDVRYSLAA